MIATFELLRQAAASARHLISPATTFPVLFGARDVVSQNSLLSLMAFFWVLFYAGVCARKVLDGTNSNRVRGAAREEGQAKVQK